ncbi:MAG: RNA polymerase sigma-54 factor [Phycisphaerales bacterium]|nr:RNA polymerase sigma-54 factor [Phycisphaerales bacterium]
MRINLSQQPRLSQQMKLSPQMIQAMEILQLQKGDLLERIEEELTNNVSLDRTEVEALSREERERERLDSALPSRKPRNDGEHDSKMAAMANTPGRCESLEQQLLNQWAMAEADQETMAAGRAIIAWIGEDGLLAVDMERVAAESGVALTQLAAAISAVQEHLEPTGLGARSIRECLLLQLAALTKRAGEDESASIDSRLEDARLIIADHLDDLEANRIPRIVQRSGLTSERITAAREVLRHLDPAPGRMLVRQSEPGVVPDVVVEFDADNDCYVAALAEGSSPALCVRRDYELLSEDKSTDARTRTMLRDGARKARWFIEAVSQRSSTLLRVAREVVKHQRAWLDEGAGALRPLPMTDVAADLGLNVSTVSRAVAGKWMQTPRGVVDLRRFFSGGTETEAGGGMAWDSVREMVREVIAAEDKSKPLSDERITQALQERGVTLARRTVVKYREQMGIFSARLRRVHT